MSIVTRKKSEHWYTKEGEPMYDAGLRDARKLGLIPGVSNILSVWPKEALMNWRIEQAIMSCLTLVKKEGETLDLFAKRCVEDSEAEVAKAAAWGTDMHNAVEHRLSTGEWYGWLSEGFKPHMKSVDDWIGSIDRVFHTERIVVNRVMNYAGKLDADGVLKDGRSFIVDFKGRKVRNGKIAWYDEQSMQLAAYRATMSQSPEWPDVLLSVVIDRETGGLYVKEWSDEDAELAWERFKACLNLWRLIKKF